MPKNNYIQVIVGDEELEIPYPDQLGLTINYSLEDAVNFTQKKGSSALSLRFPATLQNDKVSNQFSSPSVSDLTADESYRGIRNAIIKVAGQELLVGKAFLVSGKHKAVPTEYMYDFYGNNSDWIIALKEITLFDLLSHLQFTFNKANIVASWEYDGTDENLPYCFIPIRYGMPMESAASLIDGKTVDDYNMRPDYMQPSLSKYWIIYWGFKAIGYKVKSDFFDSEYFRRQMMPWTWGNFLYSDGTRLDSLKFLAMSSEEIWINYEWNDTFVDVKASNDSINGGYDNTDSYEYDATNKEMSWTYPTDSVYNYGLLDTTMHLNVNIDATAVTGSYVRLRVEWFKNGTLVSNEEILTLDAPTIGRRDAVGNYEKYYTFPSVQPGDRLSAKINLDLHDSDFGRGNIRFSVDTFEIAYFRTPIGGTIDFLNYTGLKNYKFLDFLAGVMDEFDLVPQADSAAKQMVIEPCHPYSTSDDLSDTVGGYFDGKYLDWSQLQDLSQESEVQNYTDSERELFFKYQSDNNDGTLKKVQDRDSTIVGQAKYVFPDRFKEGKKTIENRFFAPTMHYDVIQWKTLTSEAPQMIIMAPENTSNLSAGEAQNTFKPKSIYYKGTTTDYKWVFDNELTHPYPFGFAVNYKPGGENDPILSYADELIGDPDDPVTAKGLLRRFFLQRLAIIRNGQWYDTWFKLNNTDVANFLHREYIICQGQKWELITLNYNPLNDDSTRVLMRRWSPILSA